MSENNFEITSVGWDSAESLRCTVLLPKLESTAGRKYREKGQYIGLM
jgi:hypothetical protein